MLEVGSIIENKQSILEVFEEKGNLFIRKTARSGGENDIHAQVSMLSNLPTEIAAHYPRLVSWNLVNSPIWYTMTFHNLPCLRDLVFFSEKPVNALQDKFKKVLSFLFNTHYQWKRETAPSDYINYSYKNRMIKRLAALKNYDNLFDTVLAAKEIIIGERVLKQPLKVLEKIFENKNVRECITPKNLCSIHGQMEFDHILLDMENESSEGFILLDPRGFEALGDVAYDIGKIWQSSKTMVDLLESEKYELKFRLDNETLVFDFELLSSNRQVVSQSLYQVAKEFLSDIEKSMGEENLIMRGDFAEAVHLCSAVPFYYEGNHKLHRALACYLLGAIAFNNFMDIYF